jgi:uncharacterized protein involved in exopolysaccharide biosynthesis
VNIFWFLTEGERMSGHTHPEALSARPDARYLIRVWRRQYKRAAIVATLAAVVAGVAAYRVKNVYKSEITVVIDRRDLDDEVFAGKAWAMSLIRNFDLKFTSQDFIQRVIDAAGIANDISQKSMVRKIKDRLIGSASENSPQRDLRFIEVVRKSITTDSSRNDGGLTLSVEWDSAEEAQRIASQAMEAWIVSEIEDERTLTKQRLDGLTMGTSSTEQDGADGGSQSGQSGVREDRALTHAAGLEKLAQEVRELEEQVASSAAQRRRQRVDLEVELDRLRGKLTATHPEIESREAELDAMRQTSPAEVALAQSLESKRSELTRSRLRLTGRSVADTDAGSKRVGASLIRELEASLALLEGQLHRPELRSRFHVIKAASYDAKPFKRKRVMAAIYVLACFIAVFVFVMIYGEVFSPLARDTWRVEVATERPVLGQISEATMETFPAIDLKIADQLRAHLGKPGTDPRETRALLAYRQIEMAIRGRGDGKILLLVEGSARGGLKGFYKSLFAIFASDVAGKTLIIDTNHVDPLDDGNETRGFLAAVESMSGDFIISAESSGQGYDMIAAGPPPEGTRTRLYQVDRIRTLLRKVSHSYEYVIIRGLPETHFMENSALAAAASGVVMISDARVSTIEEVRRGTTQLGAEKVHGIIMVAT